MISIQTGMLVALGFFIASLVWLLLASAFWSRAVRLTTARLKRSMPVSEAEIKADRDRLRAEHALKVHSLEKRLEQAKLERARHVIEMNRREARISALETEIEGIRGSLDEHQNARRVLEQTVADRLPKVEARLGEAKRLLFNRDREIADLTEHAKRHKLALDEASAINAQKNAEIERLNSALVARGGRRRRSSEGDRAAGGQGSQAELDSLRSKTREQAALIDRLQRRVSRRPVMVDHSAVPAPTDAREQDSVHETIANAEAELRAAREPAQPTAPVSDAAAKEKERETRALEARIEDQAGEIARLNATLAALEQTAPGGGLKDSKLALRARADSAEAQAERQAATISRLRAELAAANERLARQAAHFMDEMRRTGTAPDMDQSPSIRNGTAHKLARRVADVRPPLEMAASSLHGPAETDAANGPDELPRNGHEANSTPSLPERAPGPALVVTSAAEMPQTTAIPEQPRKLRLLDRITSLSKS